MTDRVSARSPLRALGWDHPRCVAPMQACSAAWAELHPQVRIQWDLRSLEAFGDEPLHRVAGRYDLLTIDHPLCGLARDTNSLIPLDALLPDEVLRRLASDSLGPSLSSYSYEGDLWAVPVDGACQVSAVRDDLLDGRIPESWADALDLARDQLGAVALPLAPAHAISSFLTYCAALGAPAAVTPSRLVDPGVGVDAIAWLRALVRAGPAEALGWEPPDVLDLMTSTDAIAYVPLTFGYVTYGVARSVERPCRFVDLPRGSSQPVGAVLGGVGLAVSRSSRHPAEAAAFAAWVADAVTQREIVAPAGGQPASLAAWLDPAVDEAANAFYSGTLESMRRAWVRPRDPWWPRFQLEGGRTLRGALARGDDPAHALRALESAYRSVRGTYRRRS